MRRLLSLSTLVAGAPMLVLAGCGGGSDPSAAVRAELQRFASATASHDYQTLCTQVFTSNLVEALTQEGLTCEKLLAAGLGHVNAPRLTVRKVTIKGVNAQAVVTSTAVGQSSATDTIDLVKQGGGWRIAQLAVPQTPARAAPVTPATAAPVTPAPTSTPAPAKSSP
jgi:hypothetical protein